MEYLSRWLKPVTRSSSSKWKKCWRASVDGWLNKIFHKLCDYKGPTVLIVRVDRKYIFGGYTSLSWGNLFLKNFLISNFYHINDLPWAKRMGLSARPDCGRYKPRSQVQVTALLINK